MTHARAVHTNEDCLTFCSIIVSFHLPCMFRSTTQLIQLKTCHASHPKRSLVRLVSDPNYDTARFHTSHIFLPFLYRLPHMPFPMSNPHLPSSPSNFFRFHPSRTPYFQNITPANIATMARLTLPKNSHTKPKVTTPTPKPSRCKQDIIPQPSPPPSIHLPPNPHLSLKGDNGSYSVPSYHNTPHDT